MKKRQLTEEQAAQIFDHRFSPGTTPRSNAYKAGFREKLKRIVFPIAPRVSNPHKPGTADFDAWESGLHHADNSVCCFWSRLEDDEAAA